MAFFPRSSDVHLTTWSFISEWKSPGRTRATARAEDRSTTAMSTTAASDPIWHALEWIVEDALPAQPTRVRIRIAPSGVIAEHDGALFPRSAAALALVVARRGATLTRVSHGATTLEVRADGSARSAVLPASARADAPPRTSMEWERPAPPAGATPRRCAGEAASYPLRLCDVRAFLQFLPAGGTRPIAFALELLGSAAGSAPQHLTVAYEPPLCGLRMSTAEWLGRSSDEAVGAAHCTRADVSFTATAALEEAAAAPGGAAGGVAAVLLLPFVDGLPLPRDKQRACARELVRGVDWARFGLALAEPQPSTGAPSGGAPAGAAPASSAGGLDALLADGGEDARALAALRLSTVEDGRPVASKRKGRSAAEGAPATGGAGPSAARGAAGDAGAGGFELLVSLHVHTLTTMHGGTSTVARWDELGAECLAAIAPTVAAALHDLRARSQPARQALRSRAEAGEAHVREGILPQMAASLAALAARRSDGGGARTLRVLAPTSGNAQEAEAALSGQLAALFDRPPRKKASAGAGGRRRRQRASAEAEAEEEDADDAAEDGDDDEY